MSDDKAKRRMCGAFSLVELLVVVTIISLLAVMATSMIGFARGTARKSRCISNLRQMATAAIAYSDDHRGHFPWASRRVGKETVCWDFITDASGDVRPGDMWDGYGISSVMQCPEFIGGRANWRNNPYTGYNYNSSFIGKVQGDPGRRTAPARMSDIADPARTALFGDGQYSSGANKFMRAPKVDRTNDASSKSIRLSGTQGFRHGGKTNMAFCDGHVETLPQPYKYGGEKGNTAEGCGFVSADNSLYSLSK